MTALTPDPKPWLHPHWLCNHEACGTRHSSGNHCKECRFAPREGYSQNRKDYPA